MSQATLGSEPFQNSNLFSSYYLSDRIDDLDEWECDEAAEDAFERLQNLWELEADLVAGYKEDELLDTWIDKVIEVLGFDSLSETTLPNSGGYTDRLLFESAETRRDGAAQKNDGDQAAMFGLASAILEAKQWDADFTTRFAEERKYRDASHQIKYYLEHTPERLQWGILTNGRKWRLYGTKDYATEIYYEVDLPELLESGDLERFKYFYAFFRREAFRETAGTSFLDTVWSESETAAQQLGEDLQDNVFTALRVLGEGFVETNDLDIDPEDAAAREELKEQSLVLLYRLMFILYAESRGLIHPDDPAKQVEYDEHFSLEQRLLDIHEDITSGDSYEDFSGYSTQLWGRLEDLFSLIDEGEEDLGIPPYNGGLFDESTHEFLAENEVADRYLAEVIHRLGTTEGDEGKPAIADYADLDTRHLGSIYEGLLEHEFRIAPEQYAAVSADGGEVWKPATDVSVADAVETVAEGGLYVVNDDGERKATGAYYTPDYVVSYIVEETIDPLIEEIKADLSREGLMPGDMGYFGGFYSRVLQLKILDPAMGSAHFMTSATAYLTEQVMEVSREQEQGRDEQEIRRTIAKECIYGVDINGMAVELGKLSMWLETLAADKPLAFLDHHLKAGNSLVGSDITAVLSDDTADNGGQLTLSQSFARARQQTLGHVMDLMADLLAIDNDGLADIKSMEELYDEIRDDPLYKRLFEVANVHTAEQFGVDVPEGVYEDMAMAIDDAEAWAEIQGEDWFTSAQALAGEQDFFHWELEYPEVFFGEDGEKLDEAGFDAVIGNPPYVQITNESEDYLRETYDSTQYKIDAFHAFIEKGVKMSRDGSKFGYITPLPWLTLDNTEKLREFIYDRTAIQEVLKFKNSVFEGATVDTAIIILEKSDLNSDNEISVKTAINSENDMGDIKANLDISQSDLDDGNKKIEVRQSVQDRRTIRQIKSDSIDLKSIASVSIGIQAYGQDDHSAEVIKKRAFHAETKETENHVPLLSGDNIRRYKISGLNETWIDYGEHLHREREWEYFEGDRIFIREITSSGRYNIHAAYISEDAVCYKTVLSVVPNQEENSIFLTSLVNSSLLSWYFIQTSNKIVTDTFPRITLSDTEELPVPEQEFWAENPESNINADFLEEGALESCNSYFDWLSCLGNIQTENIKSRDDLNLRLIDHLGSYSDGPTLADIGLTQPPRGSAESILQQTAEEKPNLKIGSVGVVRESENTVEIRLTARYKPDPDKMGKDAYTETDPEPALRITDLTATEADLIAAFVPVAVDEAGGFAGFRETATKTNSLVDRLRKLTLPAVADVEAGLESYVQTKERAEELEAKIEQTDALIDEIVYELYGLTDEEIEIVEEAVGE